MDLSELNRAIRSGLRPLETVAPLRLSEWAARHFYLSAESSYVEGTWRAWPFQTAMMDCIGHDDVEEVDIRKSARVGYTKMLLAAIGYFAEHKRRNQAVWQPTDDDAKDFCKTELDPMLRDVPVMAGVFPSFLRRHKDNTLEQKKFLGSLLHIRGGKAAKNYRRLTVDVAFIDELDGFDLDIEGEGSPVTLAAKRVEGATFPKQIRGSTPHLKGFSLIEARHDQADKRFLFHIPCPHCNTEHPLRWGSRDAPYGFKWQGDSPETVAHLCEACGTLYTQSEYFTVWQRGRWIAQDGTWIDPECVFRDPAGNVLSVPRAVSFSIWTGYSPQQTWVEIVRAWLKAVAKARSGDKGELKSFLNTTLGESYEEEVEKADEHALMARAEAYPLRRAPLGVLVIVAGVDVQDNRFEVVLWGLGRGEEMWPLDYTVLEANPADERDWAKLDAYLQSTFPHAGGGKLRIEATAIDTGGHFTNQVYTFCRARANRRIFAVKGDYRSGMPIKGRASMVDVTWRGQIHKRGVKLWHVGTDTAKDLLFGRLKVTQPGPGFVHFSKDLPPEFYTQLTSEIRILTKTPSGEGYRWVKRGGRNEVLDCTVYALFCSHLLDLHRYTETMWAKLEAAVQPRVRDIFEGAPAPEEVQASEPEAKNAPRPMQQIPAPPPRRPGFVQSWKR